MSKHDKRQQSDRNKVQALGRQWFGDGEVQLPAEMADRAEARELRAFLDAFLAIDDPADRRKIIRAVESAAS